MDDHNLPDADFAEVEHIIIRILIMAKAKDQLIFYIAPGIIQDLISEGYLEIDKNNIEYMYKLGTLGVQKLSTL